jgi:hypothetical protein
MKITKINVSGIPINNMSLKMQVSKVLTLLAGTLQTKGCWVWKIKGK